MNPEIWFPNLGIKIEHLDRVCVKVFGIEIYWYGIIIVTGIIAGMLYAGRNAKRTGQNPDDYYDYMIFALIGAIICARLYYVVFSWDDYKDNLIKIFATREGGLAIYGGIIGAIIVLFIYTKKKKLNAALFMDNYAPGLILGQAIGRWGNFFNREAYGGYTENIFAMRCLKETVGYIPKSIAEKMIEINGAEYIQVHPTFLYESLWCIASFVILILYQKKKKFNGEIIALYFILYGIGRLWIEGLRTDQLLIGSSNIAVSQVLSGILAALAGMFIVYRRKGTERGARTEH